MQTASFATLNYVRSVLSYFKIAYLDHVKAKYNQICSYLIPNECILHSMHIEKCNVAGETNKGLVVLSDTKVLRTMENRDTVYQSKVLKCYNFNGESK